MVADADVARADTWLRPPPPPPHEGDVHVWRIHLDTAPTAAQWDVLSSEERTRAQRFFRDIEGKRYVVAHGMLRHLLAGYVGGSAGELTFGSGVHGKPLLDGSSAVRNMEFNLAHSGDLALLAVARGRAVGVDVEQWNADIGHVDLADYCFSSAERGALRSLVGQSEAVMKGFFAAWSRKEAYVKATGHGVSRGLEHFDVTLSPGEPARLLGDRKEPDATDRWRMYDVALGSGYSGALVVEAPVREVLLFEAI